MDVITGDKIEQLVRQMPKVELHLHLEGAIPLHTLLSLIKKKGTEPFINSIEDLRRKFTYTDFADFIRLWIWKNSFITSEHDFEQITYDVLSDLSKQNVLYAELTYSPGRFSRQNLSVQGITEYVIAGKQRAYADFGIRSELIVDLVRDAGPVEGMRHVEELASYLGKGLIGITLGGSEHDFPPEPYADVYARARDLGYRLSAHAGEAAGADSIWGVIRKLGVERIGHGMRANEDAKLVAFLKEKQIPLEVCPVSNVKTGVCESIKDHPIKQYYDEGLMVTVNSDDPTMFGTTITDEYLILVRELGFTISDIKQLSMNGIEAAFMPDSAKNEMKNQFKKQWEQLN